MQRVRPVVECRGRPHHGRIVHREDMTVILIDPHKTVRKAAGRIAGLLHAKAKRAIVGPRHFNPRNARTGKRRLRGPQGLCDANLPPFADLMTECDRVDECARGSDVGPSCQAAVPSPNREVPA